MPRPEQEIQQNVNASPQNSIAVTDYKENEAYLADVKNAQKTIEDLLWFSYEYNVKNDHQAFGIYYPEHLRNAYGFNSSGLPTDNEQQILNGLRTEIMDKASQGGVEAYKHACRSLGSLETRTLVLGGRCYDRILQALGPDTPQAEDKAYYLYNSGEFQSTMNTGKVLRSNVESDLHAGLQEYLDREFDYKTVTFRQFAQRLGINYEDLKQLPPEDQDRPYLNHKRLRPDWDETQLKNYTLNELAVTFTKYFISKGQDAELGRLTEEQRRLYRQGLNAGQRMETFQADQIQPWIDSQGEQLGEQLRQAACLSMMKESRRVTQLSDSFGFGTPGWLDRQLSAQDAQMQFVDDLVRGTKEPEQVNAEILRKANRRFFKESLQKYPGRTPAAANYDNYLLLHTGRRAGKTPDDMVENLAKTLAAVSLRERNRPFNHKEIRSIAKYYKEVYALDALKTNPAALTNALRDGSSVLRTGRQLKKGLYGIPSEKQAAFCAQMQTLHANLQPPEKRSKDYRRFYEAVQAAGTLEQRLAGKAQEERDRAFAQANLTVFEAAVKYMDGKEIVRFLDSGKISFDHSLDALAICAEANQSLRIRTDAIIRNINRIRNHNDPAAQDYIDSTRLSEYYGAERSSRHAEDYNRPRPENRQNRPDANAPLQDAQAPAVPAEPRFPDTQNIPKTPTVPRLPKL